MIGSIRSIGVLAAMVACTSLAWAETSLKRAKPTRENERNGTIAGSCSDGDGDGYGVGGTCLGPDCNDGNGDINPGESESCNGIDDNCDGQVDEGFTVLAIDATPTCGGGDNDGTVCSTNFDCPGGGLCRPILVLGNLPIGRACAEGTGVCRRTGVVACEAGAAACNAVPGSPETEGDPDETAASCFDFKDNDCDGTEDHADSDCTTPELCDGFDNDNNGLIDDGLDLGAVCTAGIGACAISGNKVCKPDKSVGCNVSALTPGVENTPGGPNCMDGVDNDCDGVIDLADSGCQEPEKCDGKDNDGDTDIDEDFDVGAVCSKGVGACEVSGAKVCNAAKDGTICNAVPLFPTGEVQAGNLCGDGLDNDCDGTIDDGDTSCSITTLTVSCALQSFHHYDAQCHTPADAFYEGYALDGTTASGGSTASAEKSEGSARPPDQDTDDSASVGSAVAAATNDSQCERKYRVYYETPDAQPSDVVTAEFLVFDESGAEALSIPVENGDIVRLNHQLGVPPAVVTTPPSPFKTHVRKDDVAIDSTFTLERLPTQQKLPPALYVQVLRLPEGRLIETTKIPLDCYTQLWPGTDFGSFEVVSLVSWVTPYPGRSCTGGLKAITLRYTGDGSANGYPLVDIIASLDKALPRPEHAITGPAPLLRVSVQNATTTAQAFCGAIPYLNVIKPNGEVSTGGTEPIPVLAAIPQVNPHTLQVKVNGVDVLSALGIDPVRDLPGGPFEGSVVIGSNLVEIKNLIVLATPIEFIGNNLVSMTLAGLDCGGNVVVVDGDPVPDCKGHPTSLKFRYDGGGCGASQHLQCDTLTECTGGANFNEPVRIVIHETNPTVPYDELLLDTGSPASVLLTDVIEFAAANFGRGELPCDIEITIFDSSGDLLETQIMHTSCLQPLTAGHVFGSLRVVDMESEEVIIHIAHRECDEDSDLPGLPPSASASDPEDGANAEYIRGVTRDLAQKHEPVLHASTARGSSRSDGGTAGPVPPGLPVCYVDDTRDIGAASVFKIEVTKPVEGEVTDGGPTQVTGYVCHGKAIAEVDINGFDLDVSGQTNTPGDGENTGDLYELNFDVNVPVTNLRQAIALGDATGSFDPGSNLLVARAMDHNFNTTFDSLTFAVGPIIPAPLSAFGGRGVVAGGDDPPNFVERAFVMGINTTGITTVFTAQKDSNSRCIKDRTKRKFREQTPPPREIDVECDPEVSMTINGTEFQKDGDNVELDITVSAIPAQDQINVRLDLPPLDIRAHFGGYCESGCLGDLCAVCVTVDVDATLVRKNMNLSFVVTEQNILQTGIPREERDPLDFNFDVGESNDEDTTNVTGEVDIGCVLGFFLDVIDFFVMVFTLGFVDIDLDILDFELTGDDLKDRFDSLDGDPMELEFVEMKNDEEALNDFDSKQRAAKLTDCAITPGGLAISVGSAFEPQEDKIDPEARPIPGTPLKNSPIPQPPIEDFLGNDASALTIAISDDVFNQLFYNMTQTGKLKTEFEHVRELHTFMPDDCDTIADESRRARCIGWKTQDCSAFPGRTCNAESPNAGDDCTVDAGCHRCIAGTPNAGDQCTLDTACGEVCVGGLRAGEACENNGDCNECSAGSTNAGQDCATDAGCGRICQGGNNAGAPCTTNVQCTGIGGTCVNTGTCNTAGTCDPVNNGCDKDGECETGGLRRSCIIGKLLAKKFNVRPDTQMILRAKIDEAPKLLIDDDSQCPPGAAANDPCRTSAVEVKLHVSNLTIAMIADRNNNSLVDGDELTLAECNFSELNSEDILELEDDPPGTITTDCLLFKHCLKIDVNFSMGVETVGDKNRIKMEFGGIDRENVGGYQCGGVQSLPELDFFNDRAGRDDSINGLEDNVRDNTPKLAPEGMDLGGNVSFTLDRILAIRSRPPATCGGGTCSGGFNNGGPCSSNADCEDGYQDFIGLTGHTEGTPGENPPCPD